MLEGSLVALITPFNSAGDVDFPALVKLVHWHVESGTDGIVPVGTTGESPTLSDAEHAQVVRTVVREVDGRIPVVAGCGSNNTAHALKLHAMASEAGADAALHVTGYYNRPDQRGLLEHFKALSASNQLPIVVYNVPARAVVDISVETMIQLAQLPGVIGVKDATGDLRRPTLEGLGIDEPFAFLTGEDGTAVAYNAAGGVGCISVTANVVPTLCAEMQRCCLDGDFVRARATQRELVGLHEALFVDPSPIGAKYACARLGLCAATTRLPLVEISDEARDNIDAAMSQLGLVTTDKMKTLA